MKVLHVIPSISRATGGPAAVALNITKALCEAGIEAEIITTNFDPTDSRTYPLNQRIDYPVNDSQNGTVPVWFLPHTKPRLKEFLFSPALTQWLWKKVHQYHLLDNHYLFSYAPTSAAAVARSRGIPYTVRTMGQLTPWALAQSRLKKKIYTQLIERHNLQKAAAIHCTADAEAEDVRRFGIQTSTVTLPLGVNLPCPYPDANHRLRQQYQLPEDIPIVLYLSRLHHKKRPELLIKSLGRLARLGVPFHLIMAGNGEPGYVSTLQDLSSSSGISSQASFPGLVVGHDKDLLLQGSDLFVLPSFSENFGIAVAEALISRLPVVITPGIQIAPEIASAQAGIVVQDNLDSLTEAILQLLHSPDRRQELADKGYRLAQNRYSWRSVAEKLIPVYEKIITHKTLPTDISA
jgi:glycosyltransferase involved in cell wall biosynthesis